MNASPGGQGSEQASGQGPRADSEHMRAALGLAARHLGQTWPNPAVGCVVVDPDGRVAGRGATATGGRPHAETAALAQAGARARGGTAYVTLEPCSHHGVTPPCVDALIASGLRRVVASVGDPDPRVDGRGFARLAQAGLTVETGLRAEEGRALLAGFATRVTRARPLVTLKLATTLDGRIATASGESRWITGPPARREGHRLRATHDAILVGIGTALADDPSLDCRLDGARTRPLVRIVLDRALRLPTASVLARTARTTPVWLLHAGHADPARRTALEALGVRCLPIPGPDAADALRVLGAEGLTRLLVEGGARIAAALLDADLVDRIAWFTAPFAIGADGLAAIAPGIGGPLESLVRFDRLHTRPLRADILQTLRRHA